MPPEKKGGRMIDSTIPPPAEIIFHEKIGAHEISVVHLKEIKGFVDWVREYLKSLGFDRNILSDTHKELVSSYINEKFTYFVFDVLTVNKDKKTLEPIQYRFKTKKIFYPLKITKLGSGYTTIEIIILTPRLLSNFSGISVKRIKLAHDPITITQDDLKTIDDDMYELLKEYSTLKLRIWKVAGEVNSFDKDLIAY